MTISTHTFPLSTPDGKKLMLHRTRNDAASNAVPLLVVHGAGVRSQIFSPAGQTSIVSFLASNGFDVWNFDWRASIDVEPNFWTLDHAAVFDYPAAVARICAETGSNFISALIHCQGSVSFMIALAAGLLPEISLVVSNAVSMHPVVPRLARLKALYAVPSLGRFMPWLNPQWGLSAPPGLPTLFDSYVRSIHHECNNPVCKWASFTYGSGFPTLWRHENLTDRVHEWIKGEFAQVPMTFFSQMSKSIRAGHIVSTGLFESLPTSIVESPPRTDARIVLLAGGLNDCFVPESQQRTFDFLDGHAPGRHSYYELAGYGHLDVFIGRNAEQEVFPLILDELRRG